MNFEVDVSEPHENDLRVNRTACRHSIARYIALIYKLRKSNRNSM